MIIDVWNKIGIDVFNYKEFVNGYKYVIIVIDYFLKWVEVVVVKDKIVDIIVEFLIKIILWNGVLCVLVLDNGFEFKN